MMNLYCYNSPLSSSVGFRIAGWTTDNEACTIIERPDRTSEAVQALTGVGAKVMCFDSRQGTRVFMMRGLIVQENDHMGWQINFALEADRKSYLTWTDLTAAFLINFEGMKSRFAGLFSVSYENGEHYDLDIEGFLNMARQSEGSAKALYRRTGQTISCASQRAFHQFAAMLQSPLNHRAGQLHLLVPVSTVRYFLGQTALTGLSFPRLCIGNSQWLSLLAHEIPEESGNIERELHKLREDRKESDFASFLIAVGVFVGALWVVGVFNSKERKNVKRKKRR